MDRVVAGAYLASATGARKRQFPANSLFDNPFPAFAISRFAADFRQVSKTPGFAPPNPPTWLLFCCRSSQPSGRADRPPAASRSAAKPAYHLQKQVPPPV
jgi:hypothetical protein